MSSTALLLLQTRRHMPKSHHAVVLDGQTTLDL
jgi:hypothetical protein